MSLSCLFLLRNLPTCPGDQAMSGSGSGPKSRLRPWLLGCPDLLPGPHPQHPRSFTSGRGRVTQYTQHLSLSTSSRPAEYLSSCCQLFTNFERSAWNRSRGGLVSSPTIPTPEVLITEQIMHSCWSRKPECGGTQFYDKRLPACYALLSGSTQEISD